MYFYKGGIMIIYSLSLWNIVETFLGEHSKSKAFSLDPM